MFVRRMREEMGHKTHRWVLILEPEPGSYVTRIQEQLNGCIPVEHYLTSSEVLSSLLRVGDLDCEAAAALFPPGCFYNNENGFQKAVSDAFRVVQSKLWRNSVIVAGQPANEIQDECDWIEPKPSILGCSGGVVRPVRRFWNKPSQDAARDLARRGCLRNTSIMIGRVDAFLKLIAEANPDLPKTIPAAEYCTHLLTLSVDRVLVITVGEAAWNGQRGSSLKRAAST
jgi:mannose-1-phosphate guanylyltransferase